MKNLVKWLMIILSIVLVLGLLWYFLVYSSVDEETEQTSFDGLAAGSYDALDEATSVPDANPFDETNPFSYENPFEGEE